MRRSPLLAGLVLLAACGADDGRTPFPTSEEAFADGRLSPGTLVLAMRPGDGRAGRSG